MDEIWKRMFECYGVKVFFAASNLGTVTLEHYNG